MKELTIEEKAKAYDEIIERLKDFQFEYRFSPFSDVISDKFPELKENEDEKIRKELLAVINDLVLPDDQQSRFVAWLEKQAEQKSVEWSKEDNKTIKEAIRYLGAYAADSRHESYSRNHIFEIIEKLNHLCYFHSDILSGGCT